MNLLARILSHGFALAVVVLIAITLMYRGDLFPEWGLPEFLVVEDKSGTGTDGTPATVDSTLPETVATSPESATEVLLVAPQVEVPQVEVPQVEVPQVEAPQVEAPQVEVPQLEVTEEVVTQDVVSPVEVVIPDTVDAPEQLESPLPDMVPSTPAAEPVTEPQPEFIAAPATVTVTESEAVTEQPESPAPDVTAPVLATEQVADTEPESAVAEAPAAALESNAGKSAYESLAAAREAYWLHDYAGAENHYRLLIELEPDNPDWHGELGNMYFAQGQWEQAAAAYYEAGVRLLNDGMVAQARKMVNVIRGLNGAEADDLETQINAVDQVTQ